MASKVATSGAAVHTSGVIAATSPALGIAVISVA